MLGMKWFESTMLRATRLPAFARIGGAGPIVVRPEGSRPPHAVLGTTFLPFIYTAQDDWMDLF